MGKKESLANRQYSAEFKVEAVKLGESIGGNQAAKPLGIPEPSLWNWIKLSRAGKLKVPVGGAVAVKRWMSEVEAGEHSLVPRTGEHQAGSRKS